MIVKKLNFSITHLEKLPTKNTVKSQLHATVFPKGGASDPQGSIDHLKGVPTGFMIVKKQKFSMTYLEKLPPKYVQVTTTHYFLFFFLLISGHFIIFSKLNKKICLFKFKP